MRTILAHLDDAEYVEFMRLAGMIGAENALRIYAIGLLDVQSLNVDVTLN